MKLKLALDWTPNTIHTGFYVAQQKGWYQEAGLEVEIISPAVDNYAKTPARKVADGEVDLAIAPSESVLSYNTLKKPIPLKAIAAVLQQDTSAIVTLKETRLDRPALLDGKRYASYKARFEDGIVRKMVQNDGGAGDLKIIYPEKLGIWNTLLEGQAEATWVFLPWEGVEAKRKGVRLNAFQMDDYGIPYGYSPVLVAHEQVMEEKEEALKKFLAATSEGYIFATPQIREMTEVLKATGEETFQEEDFIWESLKEIRAAFIDKDSRWGHMQASRWEAFLDWLHDHELLLDTDQKPIARDAIRAHELFSNMLLTL